MTDQQSFLKNRRDVLVDEFLTLLGRTDDNRHEFHFVYAPKLKHIFVYRGEQYAGKVAVHISDDRLHATFEVDQDYDPDHFQQTTTRHQNASHDAPEHQNGQSHE